jgi:hypothetical protein
MDQKILACGKIISAIAVSNQRKISTLLSATTATFK